MSESNRLETLIDQYGNTLYRAALALLGDVQEAEDAVQDAFVRYLERQPAFESDAHAGHWLMKVALNGCKSRLRRKLRRPTVELLDIYPAPDGDSRELVEAVLALPPKQRAAVHLHYYEGYTTDEIARMLGQRPGTVRSHLSRAREALREQLKGEFG